MRVPATHDDDVEVIVTSVIAAALRSQGVRIAEGARVRLTPVPAGAPLRRRSLGWLGAVTSGRGDLSERAKDDIRSGLGSASA